MCTQIIQSILHILVREKKNMWISFFHIEEFFNNLDSNTIIQVDGLFGYLRHVIYITNIKFTLDMNSIFAKTANSIF